MIKLSKKKIQKEFGRKVEPLVNCLGVDTASRTGWCKIITGAEDVDTIEVDYGFVNIKSTDKYFKYNQYIEIFSNMLTKDLRIVIEESFFGQNAKTFQMLSRFGGFIYALAHIRGIRDKYFILATSSRKFLGIKGNMKKKLVQEEFRKRMELEVEDDDIIDAIILAFNGILEPDQVLI